MKPIWANVLHFYQPPYQKRSLLERVIAESYRPLIETLFRTDHRVSLNLTASLLSQLSVSSGKDLLPKLAKLIKNRKVEVLGTSANHAFLPLLPTWLIEEEIKLQERRLKKFFGLEKPEGFFPPELAINNKVVEVVKRLGYKWLTVSQVSVRFPPKIPHGRFSGHDLSILVRNRSVSRRIVSSFSSRLIETWPKDPYRLTVNDAELYGHHKKAGLGLLENYQKAGVIFEPASKLLKLDRQEFGDLVPATWETERTERRHNPFPLWSDEKNELHGKSWRLLYLAAKLFKKAPVADPGRRSAQLKLRGGIASCQWWWATKNYWHPDMVVSGATETIKAIRSLRSADSSEKRKAEQMYADLLRAVWDRHWRTKSD